MRQRVALIHLFIVALFFSCSTTKYVPDGKYLLDQVELTSDSSGLDVSIYSPYIRQKPNSRWFSMFRVPLRTYSLSGRDSSRWLNRSLKRMGEEPVIFDSVAAQQTLSDLVGSLQNHGFLHGSADLQTQVKGKKIKATYRLHPGLPYYLRHITYRVDDDSIAQLLRLDLPVNQRLKQGDQFSVEALDAERKRITSLLQNLGYFKFNKDVIHFYADSTSHDRFIDLTLELSKFRSHSGGEEQLHPRYTIGRVNFLPEDSTTHEIHLRHKVLVNNTQIAEDRYFSNSDLQTTYSNFSRLQAVRYTNIQFRERPDSSILDCNIQVSTNKPSSLSFSVEGTNTAGDFGAAAALTYTNNNLFRGSEVLSVKLRGAFEAITGLEGYQNQDYEEYSVETKLTFPQFVAPFVNPRFRYRRNASSELAVDWNLQNRPEFHRRVFSTAWRYRWSNVPRKLTFRFDVFDLDYVLMPWISETFKRDYLDDESNRNAILRYNYEDLFIMKLGFGITYNDHRNILRINAETAGNLLNGVAHAAHFKTNDAGQYKFLDIAFAQYAKFDFDYTHQVEFDKNNSLALHAGLGVAYPYGNSTVLPFEKRYFSGGANSVRGWSVRSLGPGRFKGHDGRIDFINQTGDMKLDLNLEYRWCLFWKINMAAFVDAGNIWTLREYKDQPGGQFKLDEFYKQIAAAYGLGFRLNFDYFILRFDMGMKAINPAYDNQREHWAVTHPNLSRDFSFHFAVGLPF